MSKRTIMLLVAALLISTAYLGTVNLVRADDQPMRLLSLPDLGSLEYPLAIYSARADMSGLQNDGTSDILFPGAFTIAPNDAFVVQQLELGNVVYTVRLASVLPATIVKADALPMLLGTLPLLAYDQDSLKGVAVQSLTIDGLPAVRVDNFMNGAQKVTAHLLILNGAMVVEVVVMPAKLTGSLAQNSGVAHDEDANRAIYESIIASLKIAR